MFGPWRWTASPTDGRLVLREPEPGLVPDLNHPENLEDANSGSGMHDPALRGAGRDRGVKSRGRPGFTSAPPLRTRRRAPQNPPQQTKGAAVRSRSRPAVLASLPGDVAPALGPRHWSSPAGRHPPRRVERDRGPAGGGRDQGQNRTKQRMAGESASPESLMRPWAFASRLC